MLWPQPERCEDFCNVGENRQKVYGRDNYACRYCGAKVTADTATLDHVIPVVAGGSNKSENLVTACVTCNARKNSKSLGDFLADGSRPRRIASPPAYCSSNSCSRTSSTFAAGAAEATRSSISWRMRDSAVVPRRSAGRSSRR